MSVLPKQKRKPAIILKDISFGGRHIYVIKEKFKNNRELVVARMGDGFNKKEYAVHPKGSIVTYKPFKRKEDISTVIQTVKYRIEKIVGVRKGLVSRIKQLPNVTYNIRANIIEAKTSKKLKYTGRIGLKFEVRYLDSQNIERVKSDVYGWSYRTMKPIDQLSSAELNNHYQQASRMAVMQTVNEIGIFSEDVFSVEPTSAPIYQYDIDKKRGSYRKPPTDEQPQEIKNRLQGIPEEDRQFFNKKNKRIKLRFKERFDPTPERSKLQKRKLRVAEIHNLTHKGSNQ